MSREERRASAVARRYARALLEVAAQRKIEDTVAKELDALADLFEQDDMLRLALTDPMMQQARREEILQALLDAAKPSDEVAELLRQMLVHDRMGRVPEVEASYRLLLDEQRGVVEVEVATAAKLKATQRKKLIQTLERVTGKSVRLAETVDKDLMGGVVARMGDIVYDASIRGRLRQIREEMEAAS
jgi:F-type H+-transporting ATPase subunit delta